MHTSFLLAGRNRRIIPVLLGFLVLSGLAAAQDLPTAKPESVGLSSERLGRIDAAVQRAIDDKRIADAVTLVVRHRKVAWFKRGRQVHAAGCHVPHLLHDQGHYQHGRHDGV
jgi:hypothetical protein